MNVQRSASNIHGTGVFTREKIAEDEWTPMHGEFEPKTQRVKSVCDRFDHDEEWDFVPYKPWCWLNHAEDPNCAVDCDDEAGYFLVALRDIEAGEELTIDYGDDWKDE